MRFIKPIIIGFAGLFLVMTLISLLMPSRITLVRSVMISASPELIKNQISDPGNWKNWFPPVKNDTAAFTVSANEILANRGDKKFIIRRMNDTPGILHFVMLTSGQPDIHYRFFFNQPKVMEGVDVHWQVQTRLRWYPWEKFSGIFFNETAGSGYEQALQMLKDYCEKQP